MNAQMGLFSVWFFITRIKDQGTRCVNPCWSNYKKNRSFRIMLGLLQQFGLHWLFELCENRCWDHQLLQLQLATQSGTSPLLHHCCTWSIRWWNTRFAKVTANGITTGTVEVGFHFVAWPLLQDLRLIKSKVVSWSVSWDHWRIIGNSGRARGDHFRSSGKSENIMLN